MTSSPMLGALCLGASVCTALAVVAATGGTRSGPAPRALVRDPGTSGPAPEPDRRRGRVLPVLTAPMRRSLDPVAVRLARRREAASERRVIEEELPDLVDLLVLATAAGLTVPASLPTLIRWGPPQLSSDLARVGADIDWGRRAGAAFGDLSKSWGDPARPLIGALVSHLADGTPIGEPLARVAQDARAGRQRAAEVRARRLPVLLLFPLVLCVLPAFGLLTVAPLVAGTFRSLSGETVEAEASVTDLTEVFSCHSSSAPSPDSSPPPCAAPAARPEASPRPNTPSCCWAPPPSLSSSSPGPAGPTPSPDSSTPSWTPSSAT